MKRHQVLDTAVTPDAGTITLAQDASGYVIYSDGRVLMTTRTHGSEEAMSRIACHHLRELAHPRVMIGGLGFGFTLRAALERLPAGAHVVCVELMEAIVEWNRTLLASLAAGMLDDPRVELVVRDVTDFVRELPDEDRFDAILIDVDNGPIPMASVGAWWLYAAEGLAGLARALRPGGLLIVWSASEDELFADRMRRAGFATEVIWVAARTGRRLKRVGGGGQRHVLFVGRVPAEPPT